MRRCPVCQWVIDQDHAEALRLQATRQPDLSGPPTALAPDGDAEEAAVIMGFALV